MKKPPFDGLPKRDPDIVLRATNVLADLSPESFASIFGGFCETIQTVGHEHNDCQHAGPLVIIGIDLNDQLNDVKAHSESQIIEGSPLEPRPYKPDGLEDYDVIGMVQAHDALTTPELIQGALVEQFSTQWHLLMMLQDMADEFQALSNPDDSPYDSYPNSEFEPDNPFGMGQGANVPDFESAIHDLFDQFESTFNDANMPTNPENLRGDFDEYTPEEIAHLDLTPDGIQCESCGAVYENDNLSEAVRCCPVGDGEDDTPLDKKDPDFED